MYGIMRSGSCASRKEGEKENSWTSSEVWGVCVAASAQEGEEIARNTAINKEKASQRRVSPIYVALKKKLGKKKEGNTRKKQVEIRGRSFYSFLGLRGKVGVILDEKGESWSLGLLE